MNDNDLRNQFTAYMKKVVYHAKVDYIRRKTAAQQRTEIALPDWREPSYEQDFGMVPATEYDFEEQRLSDSFAQLPLVRRRILTLLFVQGLTAMEVSEELGCPLDFVYSNKRRALQKLRDQLQGGDCDDL